MLFRSFSATNPQAPPLLTVNIPIGLRFRDNPGGISVQGSGAVRDPSTYAFQDSQGSPLYPGVGLSVQPDQTLALVGGNVNLDGGIVTASGGRVELGAIAGAGTVGLNSVDNQLRLSVPDSVPRADISLTNAAAIDVTGNGRGSVAVTAHNLDILGGSNISAGVAIKSTPDSSSPPGDITLNTTGLLTINYPSRITNNVTVVNADPSISPYTQLPGNAGDINITAGDIYIDNRNTSTVVQPVYAALEARSGGMGSAGNISLSATGSINLIGQDATDNDEVISTQFITSTMPGSGSITLKANGSISLTNAYLNSASGNNSGNISLFGKESVSITEDSSLNAGAIQGNSGNITVTSSNGHVSIDRSSLSNDVGTADYASSTPGNAGDIKISGQSISITNGSFVGASAEQNGIKAGNISLNATDKIEISGYDPSYNPGVDTGTRFRPFLYTTVQTTTLAGSFGQAGDINVNTPTLIVSDGAILRSDSQNASPGGNINIMNANVVELINGGQLFANASSTGNAGNINLNNIESVVIGGSNPTFNQFTQKAQTFVPTDDSSPMYLLGTTSPRSGIFANTTSGQGGNININTDALVATGNSNISANSTDSSGGQISINAQGVFRSSDSQITANGVNSQLNGTVTINSLDVDLSRGLAELPVNVVDPTTLIAQTPCHRSIGSEFTITGRGGLPSNPNQILASDNVRVDLVKPASNTSNSPSTSVKLPSKTPTVKRLVPAQGWIFNDKGQVVLTAYDPTNTGSQRSWQEPASCAKR